MQVKIPLVLLLASAASAVAQSNDDQTPGEKLDDKLDDFNSKVDDLKDGVTSVFGNVKDYMSSVGADLKTILPTITGVPSDIDAFFDSVETKIENIQIPTTAWNDIKTGLYPTEVSQWIDSLPTNMRAEASQRLTDWAEDVGNDAPNSKRGVVALGALGVAGVLALAMAL